MDLLGKVLSAVLGETVTITPSLVARFPELGDARFRCGGILPRLGGWCLGCATVAGITVGRTVWLAPGIVPSAELLLHEVRHVHQFQAVRAFPIRYVLESLWRGYHHNRFEVDARRYARERMLGHSGTATSEGV